MIRRNFLKRAGRYTILGILGGGSGYLVHRYLTVDPSTCSINPFCRICGENVSCSTFTTYKSNSNETGARQ
jgi:hypothetical protein